MIVRVDPTSPLPPYAQIQEQITTMALSGVLPAGTRLPAIRHLAADLGVAPGTVARSYRELEGLGVVATRGRHGTVVRPPANWIQAEPSAHSSRGAELLDSTGNVGQGAPVRAAADALALEATHRGLDLEGALDAVRAAFGRLHDRPEPA